MEKNSISSFLLYCGIGRDDFNLVRPMLWERNILALRITSLLAGGLGLVFLVLNLFLHSGIWVPYLFLLCGSAVIFLLLQWMRGQNSIAYNIARYHHERCDGTGYPDGLSGEDIPLEARVMALADVYDALVSERVYKKAFSEEEARKIILEGSGTQFDPNLVPLFLECVKADA